LIANMKLKEFEMRHQISSTDVIKRDVCNALTILYREVYGSSATTIEYAGEPSIYAQRLITITLACMQKADASVTTFEFDALYIFNLLGIARCGDSYGRIKSALNEVLGLRIKEARKSRNKKGVDFQIINIFASASLIDGVMSISLSNEGNCALREITSNFIEYNAMETLGFSRKYTEKVYMWILSEIRGSKSIAVDVSFMLDRAGEIFPSFADDNKMMLETLRLSLADINKQTCLSVENVSSIKVGKKSVGLKFIVVRKVQMSLMDDLIEFNNVEHIDENAGCGVEAIKADAVKSIDDDCDGLCVSDAIIVAAKGVPSTIGSCVGLDHERQEAIQSLVDRGIYGLKLKKIEDDPEKFPTDLLVRSVSYYDHMNSAGDKKPSYLIGCINGDWGESWMASNVARNARMDGEKHKALEAAKNNEERAHKNKQIFGDIIRRTLAEYEKLSAAEQAKIRKMFMEDEKVTTFAKAQFREKGADSPVVQSTFVRFCIENGVNTDDASSLKDYDANK
jgi:hypothetical protein